MSGGEEKRVIGAPTLKSKLDKARRLIDHYAVDEPFGSECLKELSELTGTELRFAVKRFNPQFQSDTRHLHVTAYDWDEPVQWSWRSAIQIAHARDPEEARAAKQRHKLLFALRDAIRPGMRDFRSACEPTECSVCGSTEQVTTDHATPPFIRIALEFIELNQAIRLREVQGCGDLIADDGLKVQWIAFHDTRASYQLLCRSCNSKKGAR